MRGLLTVGLMSLLTSLLAGCAASEHYLDEERASVIVARGYLESATLHRQRLRVQFDYHSWWPELKIRQPYLAVISSDGVLNEIYEFAAVAPTPAPFSPRLRESIAELGVDEQDLEDYREDDAYTVEDGYLYANKGALLDHAPAVRRKIGGRNRRLVRTMDVIER